MGVAGGAGAVWGVSEVAGPSGYSLRLGWGDHKFGQRSYDQWRWPCGVVFLLCFLRWACVRYSELRQRKETIQPNSSGQSLVIVDSPSCADAEAAAAAEDGSAETVSTRSTEASGSTG